MTSAEAMANVVLSQPAGCRCAQDGPGCCGKPAGIGERLENIDRSAASLANGVSYLPYG